MMPSGERARLLTMKPTRGYNSPKSPTRWARIYGSLATELLRGAWNLLSLAVFALAFARVLIAAPFWTAALGLGDLKNRGFRHGRPIRQASQ